MPVHFEEEQRFRQVWLWAIVVGPLLPIGGVMLYALWQQLLLGRPFGDRPMPDGVLVGTALGTLLFSGAVIWLFAGMRLLTRVDEHGLSVRFAPFHRTPLQIDLGGLRSVEARTYSALREFGGWGIRGRGKKRAYNVSGDRGVQLDFQDGRVLLIGSLRAGQLERAIRDHLAARRPRAG